MRNWCIFFSGDTISRNLAINSKYILSTHSLNIAISCLQKLTAFQRSLVFHQKEKKTGLKRDIISKPFLMKTNDSTVYPQQEISKGNLLKISAMVYIEPEPHDRNVTAPTHLLRWSVATDTYFCPFKKNVLSKRYLNNLTI